MKKTALRRLVAATGALALAVAGALALGTTASAAPGPGQPTAPGTGSLTINKYAGQPTDNPSAGDLLDGVQFTITRVGKLVEEEGESTCEAIDLTDAAQWADIGDLYQRGVHLPRH